MYTAWRATRRLSPACPKKMQRLLDSYLDGDVERELYQDKRAEILGKKKLLEEQIEQATLGVSTWVEPDETMDRNRCFYL